MQIHSQFAIHLHRAPYEPGAITSVYVPTTTGGHAVIEFHTSPDDVAAVIFAHDPEALETLGPQALALAEQMEQARAAKQARKAAEHTTKGA